MPRLAPAFPLGLLLLASTALAAPRPAGNSGRAKLQRSPLAPRAAEGEDPQEMTLQEARRTVTLLNDVYRFTLDEIHRRYPVGTGQAVVAAVPVRDVQIHMNSRHALQSRFVAVDTRAMNPDHIAKDDWERKSVEALAQGGQRVETVEGGRLRVMTVVPLNGTCFPCHSTSTGGIGRAAISWTVPIRGAGPTTPAALQKVAPSR